MTIWGERAERLLEAALDLIRSEGDALPAIGAAETALRIEAGELSPGAMDGYPFPGEDGCTCPPGMRERGGFMSDCRACCPDFLPDPPNGDLQCSP